MLHEFTLRLTCCDDRDEEDTAAVKGRPSEPGVDEIFGTDETDSVLGLGRRRRRQKVLLASEVPPLILIFSQGQTEISSGSQASADVGGSKSFICCQRYIPPFT